MKIAMACDHGAFTYKEEIKKMLTDEGYEVVDCGCHSEASVDYPDLAEACANKVKGIRCGLCTNSTMARLTREHNNANMLAMGQRTTGIEVAKEIVHTFLTTKFSEGERHIKRIEKISNLEK